MSINLRTQLSLFAGARLQLARSGVTASGSQPKPRVDAGGGVTTPAEQAQPGYWNGLQERKSQRSKLGTERRAISRQEIGSTC